MNAIIEYGMPALSSLDLMEVLLSLSMMTMFFSSPSLPRL